MAAQCVAAGPRQCMECRRSEVGIAHRAVALDPLDEPLSTLAVVAGTPRGQQVAILSTAGVL